MKYFPVVDVLDRKANLNKPVENLLDRKENRMKIKTSVSPEGKLITYNIDLPMFASLNDRFVAP